MKILLLALLTVALLGGVPGLAQSGSPYGNGGNDSPYNNNEDSPYSGSSRSQDASRLSQQAQQAALKAAAAKAAAAKEEEDEEENRPRSSSQSPMAEGLLQGLKNFQATQHAPLAAPTVGPKTTIAAQPRSTTTQTSHLTVVPATINNPVSPYRGMCTTAVPVDGCLFDFTYSATGECIPNMICNGKFIPAGTTVPPPAGNGTSPYGNGTPGGGTPTGSGANCTNMNGTVSFSSKKLSGAGHCAGELDGNLTNRGSQPLDCFYAFFQNGVQTGDTGEVTIAPGQTKGGEASGIWSCQADTIKYGCFQSLPGSASCKVNW